MLRNRGKRRRLGTGSFGNRFPFGRTPDDRAQEQPALVEALSIALRGYIEARRKREEIATACEEEGLGQNSVSVNAPLLS